VIRAGLESLLRPPRSKVGAAADLESLPAAVARSRT
jgi:hypothetical protein